MPDFDFYESPWYSTNVSSWYMDITKACDHELWLLWYTMDNGWLPSTDYYDVENKITWEQRCEDIQKEFDRRGLKM